MGYLFAIPTWFFGYDIALELTFAIIALAVGLYSYKVYNLSGRNQAKTFSIAFILIAASYLIQSVTNFLILSKLNENVCQVLKINSITTLNNIGFYAYMIFFITGLLTLTHTTLKTKEEKLYPLIFAVTLLSIVFSANNLNIFYLLASVLLAYMVWHYLKNYLKNRQAKTLLVLVAYRQKLCLCWSLLRFYYSEGSTSWYQ
jgi:hypothetical protein